MPKRKPKLRRTTTFDLEKIDPVVLRKAVIESPEEYSGFHPAADGCGVTFGRSLGNCEYEGKGLPEWKHDRQLFLELNIEFVVRVTCDQEGITYLEIHQNRHQSFFKFPFKGIDYKDLFNIVPDFEKRLSGFLIHNGIYSLFWALYRGKESGKVKRSEAYDKIKANFESFFKNILLPKREREIERREQDGLTITTYERIESGRDKKSEAKREKEKNKFVSDVFAALMRIESEGGKRTQLDVGNIIFANGDSEDVQSLMKNRCRLHGLKWKDILSDYECSKV